MPRIAVYVTGSDVSENEKKALGTRMLASLVNSGWYMGIERANSFLTEVDKEQLKQRSGAIDDGQISALGKQFGVNFVCIADITPVLGDFQVSARIINVETAQVSFIGESISPMKTANDLMQAANEVVKNMFGGQVATPRGAKPEQVQEPPVQTAPAPIAQQPQKQAEAEQGMQERMRVAVEREERERQEKKQMEAERKRMMNERAAQGRAEKKQMNEERLARTKLKRISVGANVSFNGNHVDAGAAVVAPISKHIQVAPQVNYRFGWYDYYDLDGGYGNPYANIHGNFSGVSVPLLFQFSTDYRRAGALFAMAGVGFDLISNDEDYSVFNSALIVGVGVAVGRRVHLDIIRVSIGTAYISSTAGLRVVL